MDQGAAWPVRVSWWMRERFPPVVYTLLVLVFHAAATASAVALTGAPSRAWPAAVVAWLLFFHLRVFDEHKDFEADQVAYPQRVLSRGLVTLPLLARLGAAAIGIEAVLAGLLGVAAFSAWVATFAFSVAMRYEFGLGAWLRDRLVLYALTHNPVVGLLTGFLWASTGAGWHPGLLWLLLLASAGSLGFELGRKIRLPDEEHPGVPSYTTALGQAGARRLLLGVHALTGLAAAGLLLQLGLSVVGAASLACGAILPGVLTSIGQRPAKQVEAGGSGALLLSLLAVAGVAWSVS